MNDFLKTTGALNDETRVKLLKYISIKQECCVCNLEDSFQMIQSRMSRHLKILKDAGFLDVRRDGRWAYYSISKNLSSFQKASLEEIKALNIEMEIFNECCNVSSNV